MKHERLLTCAKFATLTPLEPRLVKKLLPPLTSIIRTTPAMSLLYECINGIIQGGILGSADDSSGGEEIATLCVSKLRGMIMIEGDPNCKSSAVWNYIAHLPCLTICSEICSALGIQQNRTDTSIPGCSTGRRYHGLSR